jgi:hypothetical protein
MNGIDLADPQHPRMKVTREEADLLLVLVKLDFAIRMSKAVKAGGRGCDSSAVLEAYQVSESMELMIAVAYLLLNVYSGLVDDMPCPGALRFFLEELLENEDFNDPEIMDANEDSQILHSLLQDHKDGLVAKLNNVGTGTEYTQFTLKGPARA